MIDPAGAGIPGAGTPTDEISAGARSFDCLWCGRPWRPRAARRLADGREFTIPKVHYAPDEIAGELTAAGFGEVDVRTTGRFFILAWATAP